LHTDWQTVNVAHEHEQGHKAREAAEELFRTKQPTSPTEASFSPDRPPPPEHQPPRVPRILAVQLIPPAHTEMSDTPTGRVDQLETSPVRRKAKVAEIPTKEYGRIRALTAYGMTIEQVAELYEVPAAVIERIAARG
jgi:hypothetical protein